MLKKLIPSSVKLKIKLALRKIADQKSGIIDQFASIKTSNNNEDLLHKGITIEQPIFYNPLSANKVFNIALAISEIQKIIIAPNQIFSFWHIVGNPTTEKGYKIGRNIIGNKLQEDIGGGLCQVSGLLYHLALTNGLEIIERHNHTLDLYQESKRYTPLGADATVVYGYKDLRFKNTLPSPIQFTFQVSATNFKGVISANVKLSTYTLSFDRKDFTSERTIHTYRLLEAKKEFINLSRYKVPE